MSEYIGIYDVRQMACLRMERRGKIAERGACGCLRIPLSGLYRGNLCGASLTCRAEQG